MSPFFDIRHIKMLTRVKIEFPLYSGRKAYVTLCWRMTSTLTTDGDAVVSDSPCGWVFLRLEQERDWGVAAWFALSENPLGSSGRDDAKPWFSFLALSCQRCVEADIPEPRAFTPRLWGFGALDDIEEGHARCKILN